PPSRREVGKHFIFSPSHGEGEREGEGSIELWRGLDHTKDQSYFLATLTEEQLAACEFPLGEWRKEDVRAEAKRRGLPNWDRHSTSGVCFLGHVNLAEFLSSQSISPERSETESKGISPATVVTTTGEVIGTIPSAEALTIGQRAPIAGQSAPRYVVAQEVSNSPTLSVGEARRVVVSATPDDPARFTAIVHAVNPHWIGSIPSFPLHCSARIRHRQEPQTCTVNTFVIRHSSFVIHFDAPLTGVAPGQAIVFSDVDRILGSATIAPVHG
ncbi:hypothetical protein HY635_04375, partial [Candidatus Uhrbacteria bacterium]|nr:hypothetical protein [Candidatus Uhrbacteria bacterium]